MATFTADDARAIATMMLEFEMRDELSEDEKSALTHLRSEYDLGRPVIPHRSGGGHVVEPLQFVTDDKGEG